MPPRMTTQSAGRLTVAPQGGRIGGLTGRGGGRTREPTVQTRGQKAAIGMTWKDFKALMREELCPNNEMQKLETEFWCHAMVGVGHAAYTD
ncbi:hypothetical protein Tco_1323895 [Tanacetum coccineum]